MPAHEGIAEAVGRSPGQLQVRGKECGLAMFEFGNRFVCRNGLVNSGALVMTYPLPRSASFLRHENEN